MTNVVLTIGDREYSMTCAAGEEAHIHGLGRMIDEKLATLPEGSNQNDCLSLLFAALLLADELHELRKSTNGQGRSHAIPPPDATGLSLGGEVSPEQLDALARRLEALVDVLGIAA